MPDTQRPETAAGPTFSPLYRQIKAAMLQSLQQAEWRPGDVIPSEAELAVRFKVSQGTVRKAVDELAADNLLVRRQGRGTFVSTHAEAQSRFRFLRLTPDDGSATQLTRQLIDCRRQRAPLAVARSLRLAVSDAVVRVRRVLSLREAPVVFDDIWLPATLFGGLTAERLSAYSGPMYGLFEAEFGVHMVSADEQIRAVAAEGVSAERLRVLPGSPLLSVERLSMTYDGRPVELRHGLYNTWAHHYRNALN